MAAHSNVAVKTRDTNITSAPPGRSKRAGNWIALASVPEGRGTGERVEWWAGRGGWGVLKGKAPGPEYFIKGYVFGLTDAFQVYLICTDGICCFAAQMFLLLIAFI